MHFLPSTAFSIFAFNFNVRRYGAGQQKFIGGDGFFMENRISGQHAAGAFTRPLLS
jgi:hypothetical protein